MLMENFSDLEGTTSSTRMGMTVRPLSMARLTSRLIWCESLALLEKTSTMMGQASMASTIDSVQSEPNATSRGAIQQRMPLASRMAQTASAVILSWLEWLMKTS
jgi:hypothetical protein